MIIYLSSAISPILFSAYLKDGCVTSGMQAQRFNSLVIEGLGYSTKVIAVGHPQYSDDAKIIGDKVIEESNVTYYILGNNTCGLRKVSNFWHLIKICRDILSRNTIDGVICDAISPLYSLAARLLSRWYGIPSIAIVTDIPVIMDANHPTVITHLSQKLMAQHDGYVLLTEAMNKLVNPKGKPYIIMEGICDDVEIEPSNRCNNDKFICVYTGSLSRQVGIEPLLNAFEKLNNDNAELIIYGKGSCEDLIIERGEKDEQIKYGGLVTNEEAARIQREADLLINPRPSNIGYAAYSFPSKIMEYMASGTPVLTTRLSGIPQEYYKYVYAINNDTTDGIYNALQHVLNLPEQEREAKGRAAQEYVKTRKNKRVQGKRILDMMSSIKELR